MSEISDAQDIFRNYPNFSQPKKVTETIDRPRRVVKSANYNLGDGWQIMEEADFRQLNSQQKLLIAIEIFKAMAAKPLRSAQGDSALAPAAFDKHETSLPEPQAVLLLGTGQTKAP